MYTYVCIVVSAKNLDASKFSKTFLIVMLVDRNMLTLLATSTKQDTCLMQVMRLKTSQPYKWKPTWNGHQRRRRVRKCHA